MPVFRSFFRMLWKTKISIILYFVIFIALMLAFTSTSKDNENTTFSTSKISVGIIDEDNTELSKELVAYLKKESDYKSISNDPRVIQDDLFYRDIQYVLYIPEGYEKNMMDGQKVMFDNVKVQGSYSGSFMDQKVNTYVNTLSAYLQNGFAKDKACEKLAETLKEKTEVTINNDTGNDGTRPGYYYFYDYFAYVIIILVILGLGSVFSQINRVDVQRRLKASPYSNFRTNMELICGSGLYAIGVWGALILISIGVYSGTTGFFKDLPYLMLNSFSITVVAVSIGYLAGIIVKTSSGLNGIGNVFSLGFAFLGGVFVDQSMMSAGILKISKFVPTYWYMKDMYCIFDKNLKEVSIRNDYLIGILIQLSFAVMLFSISLVVKKIKTKE